MIQLVNRAVAQFAVSALAAVVLLGAASVELMQRVGTDEAINNAKEVTAFAGQGIVEPYVTPALERGNKHAIKNIDDVVRSRVLNDRLVRVKIWTRDGHILYSDALALIGDQYPLDKEDLAAFDGGVEAEVSDLTARENKYERRYGKLLEVYLPIHDEKGRTFLFEGYLRFSSVSASGRRLWLKFAPAILGVLLLLYVVQMPLAWRLARRLREGQKERERLLRHAIESSELERRRIAQELHDGAVQNLAGVSYSLAAVADKLDDNEADRVQVAVRDAAAETRRTIRELRSLLVDLYPPDLHRAGLAAALRDLVARLSERGIEVQLDLGEEMRLPPQVEALFFRVAQEGVRNALAHADAQHVDVRMRVYEQRAVFELEDDGRGFAPEAEAPGGHIGLRVLGDLARDAGGRLDVRSAPGRGTTLHVEAPLA
ncbi:MAG TPA: sensor histidine kinase [Gaiellaceae bacterium]|nr:sensor histidine kinase [Gaiellaceae bacterium]